MILHLFDLSNVNSWFEYRLACKLQTTKRKKTNGFDRFQVINFRVSNCWGNNQTFYRSSLNWQRNSNATCKKNQATRSKTFPRRAVQWISPLAYGWCVENPHLSFIMMQIKSRTRCTKCNVYLCLSKGADCFVNFILLRRNFNHINVTHKFSLNYFRLLKKRIDLRYPHYYMYHSHCNCGWKFIFQYMYIELL